MSERKALRLVRAAMCTGCVSLMVGGGYGIGPSCSTGSTAGRDLVCG